MQNLKVNMKWNIDAQPIFFPLEIRKIYEKIYIKNRINIGNWIGKISRDQKKNIDWWMTKPTLRNPYTSNLINYCTVLETLEQINIKKKIQIITSSKEMSTIITENFNKRLNLQIKIENRKVFFLKKTIDFFKSFVFQLFIYLYLNIFKKKRDINLKKNYVFIDTFITPNKKLNSGFYPNLSEHLKENILFVPTITQSLNFPKLISILRNSSNNNLLFKEHYLGFSDYIFGYLHFFRREKFCKSNYIYKKYNISSIVNEEIRNFDNCNSIIVGILNYRFFKKISTLSFKIRKSINWFENQVIDRGWNLGFRKYFKKYEKNSLGYQNFTRHYNLISFSPSLPENSSNVTPNKVVVISKYFKKIAKEFNKKQIVILGPTNRFKKLNKNKIISSKRKKILLVLSGILQVDKALISLVQSTCILNNKIQIHLKDHPILPLKKIIGKKTLPKNLIPINENLDTLLQKCLITIISGPTSVIKESHNICNYIILPNVEVGTKINAERLKLKKYNYFIVNTKNEMLSTINYIKKSKSKINKSNNKAAFFENLTRKNIKIFL